MRRIIQVLKDLRSKGVALNQKQKPAQKSAGPIKSVLQKLAPVAQIVMSLASKLRRGVALTTAIFMNPRRIVAWIVNIPGAIAAWLSDTRKALAESFRRVYRVGMPFWISPERHTACVLLAVILGFSALNAGVNVFLAEASVPYSTAMKDGPISQYWAAALFYLMWMAVSTLVQAGSNASRTTLQLKWRRWLTRDLSSLYLSARNYLSFTLDTRDSKPDNPDQRQTQDCGTFTDNSVNLSMSALDSTVAIATMGWQLWTIYPSLILYSLACSVFISCAVWLLGRPLPQITNAWFKTEADLRFVLQQTRDEAEGIALARGEEIVKETVETSLDSVIGTLLYWRWISFRMQLCTIFYYMIVPLLPVAVAIGLYLNGHIEFGVLNKAAIAFAAVTGGLNFFVNQFGSLMTYFTVATRIDDMYTTLRSYLTQPTGGIEVIEGPVAKFDNVTVRNVLNQPVIAELSVTFDKNTLFTGPDSISKGAILKALDGVLRNGTGQVTRPPQCELMFLNQNPWLPTCSLRKVLCFGLKTDSHPDDAALLAVLNRVQLPSLAEQVGGLDAAQTKSWRKLMPSLSQQQRLSLARVLIAKPKYVFLDQATLALEEENEELFYQLLAEIGCIIISTATGTRLAKHHQQVVEILGPPVDGKKNWEFHPVASDYKVPGWKLLLKQAGLITNPAPKAE